MRLLSSIYIYTAHATILHAIFMPRHPANIATFWNSTCNVLTPRSRFVSEEHVSPLEEFVELLHHGPRLKLTRR